MKGGTSLVNVSAALFLVSKHSAKWNRSTYLSLFVFL